MKTLLLNIQVNGLSLLLALATVGENMVEKTLGTLSWMCRLQILGRRYCLWWDWWQKCSTWMRREFQGKSKLLLPTNLLQYDEWMNNELQLSFSVSVTNGMTKNVHLQCLQSKKFGNKKLKCWIAALVSWYNTTNCWIASWKRAIQSMWDQWPQC